MNCPHCNGRNPSDAKHCLHCATPFAEPDLGLSGSMVEGASRINWGYAATFVIVAFFAVTMTLHGFTTVEHACTSSPDEIAKFEAAPEWKRSRSEEDRKRDEVWDRKRDGRYERKWSEEELEGMQCYERATGKVKGLLDRRD